jgi:oligopeptide transport system substrate-binding protein
MRVPAPYFHEIMSMSLAFPVKEESVTAGGTDWWTRPALQIGNGPFTLATLEPNARTRFVPNLRYWRGTATYTIEYRYITDTARLLQAYAQNEVDIAGYGAAELPQVEADLVLKKQALVYPGSCTLAIMFNQRKALFIDRQVRAAFALALDREAWIHEVMSDTVLPTLSWIAPGFPGYQAGEARWAYDPERARQALAESSYGGPDALQAIDFLFVDTPRNRLRMEWLARQWQTVLGVTFVMESAGNPYGPFTSDVDRTPFVFFTGWCPDYPDPQDKLSNYWHIGGNGEQLDYDNAALDAVLTQADRSTDPHARLDLYRQAQDLLLDDVPMAITHNNAVRCLVNRHVQGIVTTPMDDTYGWCGANDPLTITLEP